MDVAARYAQRINRYNGACISLLDVLDDFPEITICVGYRLGGKDVRGMPASVEQAEAIEPVYETLPGWNTDISGIRDWNDLPPAARQYVDRLGEVIGTEISMVGVGPERTQSLVRPGSWLAAQLDR